MKEINEMTLEELREELRKTRESKDYWVERADKIEKKLNTLMSIMKGVNSLIEQE